jgi:hypothetical protein
MVAFQLPLWREKENPVDGGLLLRLTLKMAREKRDEARQIDFYQALTPQQIARLKRRLK